MLLTIFETPKEPATPTPITQPSPLPSFATWRESSISSLLDSSKLHARITAE